MLWKQECFVVLRPLQIEFFRNLLDVRQSKSLLDTLTSLRNTINGWGQCYRYFEVKQLYAELDAHVRNEVTGYLRQHKFLLHGGNLSRKQLRLLGIPELNNFVGAAARPSLAA